MWRRLRQNEALLTWSDARYPHRPIGFNPLSRVPEDLKPIVADGFHGDFVPFGGAVVPVHHERGHLIVTVGEDIRLDYNGLADRALDRETPAIDARRDVFDNDPDLGRAHGPPRSLWCEYHCRQRRQTQEQRVELSV